MDLYSRMGSELRVLFKDFFNLKEISSSRAKVKEILEMASEIGGRIEKEALKLKEDIEKFFQEPHNQKRVNELKKHALRLEQETREI